ncbi:adenylate/guanylate cyclase domain-containing protein [Leptospira sp. GIMC2001]|uniref:adenylate/guanylate cyclase domain-containing protein n=1 Tax=Leptospira sp. GIMC2001 TaxID=1513297 RepID=UPI002349878D|nr:adenylate/guanylate cyclase domain-containing protein [Leptospira sp. GIMC2001]WCL47784.1 GAF domain-containing protein [Leptospira sp. GIMC2001]
MKNKLTYFPLFYIVIYISLFFFDGSVIHSEDNQLKTYNTVKVIPFAEKGVLDLRDWDFERDGNIELKGEWNFYWNEFRNPISDLNDNGSKRYINVPGKWNDYKISDDEILSGEGHATYTLKVLMPENSPELGFKITDGQGSAYELFMNDSLVAKNGIIGDSYTEEKAEYLPQYGKISPNAELFISMLISNHIHRNGGFQTALEIDTLGRILSKREYNRLIEIFLLGVLLIISLYHFSLFFYRRKDKSALWFGLLCMVMALRLMMTGERLFIEAFPWMPFVINLKLEYIGYYALVTPFVMFLYGLFPQELTTIARRFFVYIPIAFIGLVILSPVSIFTESLFYFQILTILGMLYIMNILIRAVIKKRKGSRLIMLGFIIYFCTAINDLLFYNFYIGIGNLIPIGLFFFIFAQAAALAHRIADAFNSSEELSDNLELKVEKRTIDLENAKSEIFKMSEFTNRINSLNNLDDILSELTNYMYSNYEIAGSWLALTNESKEYLRTINFFSFHTLDPKVSEFLKDRIIPLNEESGFIYQVYKSQKPFFLKKIPNFDHKFNREILDSVGMNSFIIIPLIRNNECIGILNFTNFTQEMRIRKSDVRKISYICSQVAGSIDNNNLIEQVKRERESALKSKQISEKQKRFTESLNQLIKSLNEDLDLNTIMIKVSEYIKKNYNFHYYGLSIIGASGDNLLHAHSEIPEFVTHQEKEIIKNTIIKLNQDQGTHALAFNYKKPIFAQRIRASALSQEEQILYQLLKFESLVVIPLTLQNHPIGFLDLYNVGKISLTKEEITYLSILGEQLAGIIYSSKLYKQVEQEKERSDNLLENILPKSIAEELKSELSVKPQLIESATVLFTDFVGFTKIAESLSPEDLVRELDGCFSQFDEICKHNNLEKLKTIGDAYMCAGGLPVPNHSHPIEVCLAALEFRSFMLQMGEIKKALNLPFWELRIGIHTGSVTAGVIGTNKFAYDIWGDTVNTASRMESSGDPGRINISGATYELVKDFFECEYRGKIQAKGKGEVDMYFLLRIKPEYSVDSDGLVPNGKLRSNSENSNGHIAIHSH